MPLDGGDGDDCPEGAELVDGECVATGDTGEEEEEEFEAESEDAAVAEEA
jgi:hypothetical protein